MAVHPQSGPVPVAVGRQPEPVHTVAVYAFDGMAPFELGVVVEVFGLARPELSGLLAAPWYDVRVCADEPGTPLNAVGGFSLTARHGLDDLAAADTVMVVAVPNPFGGAVSPGLVAALRTAHERGARIVSICSGAFALAAAACWTAWRRPPTGGTPTCCSSATLRCGSTRTCCTWTTARC
ncbi:hypothetical protein ACFQ1I_22605 [Kitasatospora arboriphila]